MGTPTTREGTEETRLLLGLVGLAAAMFVVTWWLPRSPRENQGYRHHEPAPVAVAVGDAGVQRVTMSRDAAGDASVFPDSGHLDDAIEHIGALYAATVCARLEECRCGEYPSLDAPARPDTTECDADVRAEFREWWVASDFGGVRAIEDDATLLRVIDASVDCAGVNPDFLTLVVADAVAGEHCDIGVRCRDGSWCDGVECRVLARAGQVCGSASTESACEHDLECVEGRCRPLRVLGERCEDGVTGCAPPLVCLNERCHAMPGVGERCDEELGCLDGPCVEGRCHPSDPTPGVASCPRDQIGRNRYPVRPGDVVVPLECIAVGTRCVRASDCGWGLCTGESQWRCEPPGPHAYLPASSPQSQLVVQRGEDCEQIECEEGLVCELQSVAGGRCVGSLCAMDYFFATWRR